MRGRKWRGMKFFRGARGGGGGGGGGKRDFAISDWEKKIWGKVGG
jgi:hypothetical protein